MRDGDFKLYRIDVREKRFQCFEDWATKGTQKVCQIFADGINSVYAVWNKIGGDVVKL
jgi:hypothetical protein